MTLLITMMITTMMTFTTAMMPFFTTDYYVFGFQEQKGVGSTEIKHVNVVIIFLIWFADPQRVFFRFAFTGWDSPEIAWSFCILLCLWDVQVVIHFIRPLLPTGILHNGLLFTVGKFCPWNAYVWFWFPFQVFSLALFSLLLDQEWSAQCSNASKHFRFAAKISSLVA